MQSLLYKKTARNASRPDKEFSFRIVGNMLEKGLNKLWKTFRLQDDPFHGLIGFRLVHRKSFQKPAELLPVQLPHLLLIPWPLKASAFYALIQENKAISFPQQCLDSVTPSAAEQKQTAAKGIQAELTLHKLGQAIYPTAQIGVSTGDVDGFHF